METLGVASWSDRSGFICRLCRQDAKHNEVLRISYCPVHGLSSPLDALPRPMETRLPRRAFTPGPEIAVRPVSLGPRA
jgi:hypothetical protein